MMRATVTYKAKDGRVFAHTPEGVREVSSALTTYGRDLERFEQALNAAKAQRKTSREGAS